ncbi:MAG: nucleotidyltransferase domain-containing protein [Armatimonadetes bacterium]|nr:nucleotidyltransferase domain-containing protein [Armatimonadota bacterium]
MESFAQQLVDDFTIRLEELLGPRLKQLRLFGSRARGTEHRDSDVDLFVLVDHCDRDTRRRIIELAFDVTADHGFRLFLSPLVMDEEHFAGLVARERRLARDINEEGIPLR